MYFNGSTAAAAGSMSRGASAVVARWDADSPPTIGAVGATIGRLPGRRGK
jgi:hypothetical protein